MRDDRPPRRPRVGDRLVYVTGGGSWRTVEVIEVFGDHLDDRPGFDAVMLAPDGRRVEGTLVWGYDDQIRRFLEEGGEGA